MKALQPAVLAPVPAMARYLTFSLQSGANPRRALAALAAFADGESCVAGIGDSVLRILGRPISGMRPFPTCSGAGFDVPATPAALWCWLRGTDRGALLHQGRALAQALAPVFALEGAPGDRRLFLVPASQARAPRPEQNHLKEQHGTHFARTA